MKRNSNGPTSKIEPELFLGNLRIFNLQVFFYNYLGILIEEIEVNSYEIEINTSDYRSGIYFVYVDTENGSFVEKFVIE